MSSKLIRKSFKKNYMCPHEGTLVNGVQKAILEHLALIGTDSPDGKSIINIFASQPTVSDDTLFSLSTVQRAFKTWIKRKVLLPVGKKFGNVIEYKIDLLMLNFFLESPLETEKTTRSERLGGKSERPGIQSERPTIIRSFNDYYNNKNNKSERKPTSIEEVLNYKPPKVPELSPEERKKSAEVMRAMRFKDDITH